MLRTGARKQGTMLYKILNDFKRDLIAEYWNCQHCKNCSSRIKILVIFVPDIYYIEIFNSLIFLFEVSEIRSYLFVSTRFTIGCHQSDLITTLSRRIDALQREHPIRIGLFKRLPCWTSSTLLPI